MAMPITFTNILFTYIGNDNTYSTVSEVAEVCIQIKEICNQINNVYQTRLYICIIYATMW